MNWYRHGYEVAKIMDRLIPLIRESIVGANQLTPDEMDCIAEHIYSAVQYHLEDMRNLVFKGE